MRAQGRAARYQGVGRRDYPGLAEAAAFYLAGVKARPECGAIAVAAPVAGDRIVMTTHTWSFSTEAVRQALRLRGLVVLNDFEAVALALPHLGPADVEQWGGGTAVAHAPIVVLGPGTGLGVASLVWSGARWVAVTGEGVVTNLGATFDRAEFRRRFEDKGGFAAYLAPIPTFHIVHPFPALVGLAHAAAEPT